MTLWAQLHIDIKPTVSSLPKFYHQNGIILAEKWGNGNKLSKLYCKLKMNRTFLYMRKRGDKFY